MTSTVFHIPHSSTVIPAEDRERFFLSDRALRRELLRMTDRYTDDLFRGPGQRVVMPVSRLVCDAERFRDKTREIMTGQGMWVCYTRTSDGEPLKTTDAAYEAEILRRYYDPHHRALTGAVDRALEQTGRCLLVDCHSFAAARLSYEVSEAQPRPQICIGTDPFHTPAALENRCRELFERLGYTVAVNTPFAGVLVPEKHYGREPRVRAVMLEVNRSLYMDEATGEKLPEYDRVQRDLAAVIAALAE